eukprot:530870_1
MQRMQRSLLWTYFILYIAYARTDQHLLSGNEPKRSSACFEPHCSYTCLPTKCTNEEIKFNVHTDRKSKKVIRPNVTLSCMSEFSCIGHILLDSGAGVSSFRGTQVPGGVGTIYCNYARQKSCQGSEFRFANIDHSYLIGDVTKSDILFKNSESVHIILKDVLDKKTEQFFMNEVFTENVQQMEIVAEASFSATGSVFDLTGVSKRIRIHCKGYGSCAGSLFIFSRCMNMDYQSSRIFCYPGACNDISVWVLDEEPCKLPTEGVKAGGIAYNKEIVRVIPVPKGKNGKPVAEWQTQNLYIVSDKVDPGMFNEWPLQQFGIGIDIPKTRALIDVEQFGKGMRKKTKADAFKVHTFKTKEEWVVGLSKAVEGVAETLAKKHDMVVNNAWMRTKEGAEAYGCSMMQTMTTRVQWGSMTQGITGVWLWLHNSQAFAHTLYAVSGPLVPMFMVLGGMKLLHGAMERKHAKDLKMPHSKVPPALSEFKEMGKQEEKDLEETEKDVSAAREGIYDSFGHELDSNAYEYMPYHGFVLGDGNEEYQVLDAHTNLMVSQYMLIGLAVVVCWCFSVLVAICSGNVCGWFVSQSAKNVDDNDNRTTTELEI